MRTNGQLWAEFTQSSVPAENEWRSYLPNGQLDYHLVTVPQVLEGDSVLELRTIYFKLAAPADTAYVEHRFAKMHENKEARKGFYSLDAAGKHPVPPDWQRAR